MFPLALLLIVPVSLLDVCDACGKGKLCKPHAQLETAEIERLRPRLESEEARDRIAALRDIAALTHEHENVPSERVAEILVLALEDRSLRVRDRAVRLLADGQHPEATVVALVDLMGSFKKKMWSLVAWLQGENQDRGTVTDAMNYLKTVMRKSGDVPDDRVVEALADVLLAMPSEMRGQPVAMAATKSLLQLGTKDAVKAVLRQFSSMSDTPEMRNIHDALRGFAFDLEIDDYPEYGEDVPEKWARWVKKHSRAMPAKLGKWRGKPVDEE